MATICVFGDSISYGAWDKEGGWVQRLRKFLDEKTLSIPDFWNTDFTQIYNVGISSASGENSNNLLKRFEFEAKQRLDEYETIFIFAIGKNDSCFIKNKNTFITSLKIFEKNIQDLIKLAKKYSSKIIFVGTAMVDESKTAPISWDKNMYYKNEYLKQYNEIIKSVCEENKVYFIEIFEKWKKLNYKSLLEDGLHPNSKGHKKIFEAVKEFLIKNKLLSK